MTKFFRITGMLVLSAVCCHGTQGDELELKALESTGLQLRWVGQAVLNANRDSIRHITNDEDLIFVQSSAGIVSTFNSENGRRLWSIQIGRNDEYGMPAVTNKDTLLIVTGPVVHGLNKFTGDEFFDYRLPSQPTAAPGMYEYEYSGRPGEYEYGFLVPLIDGSVVAYQIDRLKFQQRYGKLPLNAPFALSWRYFSGEGVQFPPVAGSETIAIGTEAGNIHAVNVSGLNTGKSLYQLFLKSPVSAPPTYVNRPDSEVVYIATADNRLFCFELTKGANMRWTLPLGGGITSPVVAVDNDVYLLVVGNGLMSVSAESGLPQRAALRLSQVLAVPNMGIPVGLPVTITWPWKVPGINSIAAVSKFRVYGVDKANRLAVIDRRTSQVLSWIPVRDYTYPLQNSVTDRIYLTTKTGHIACLAETGSDFVPDAIGNEASVRGLLADWSTFPIPGVVKSNSEFAEYHQNPDRRPVMPSVPAGEPRAETGSGLAP